VPSLRLVRAGVALMKFRIVVRKTIVLEREYELEATNALLGRRAAIHRASVADATDLCGPVTAYERKWTVDSCHYLDTPAQSSAPTKEKEHGD